MSESLICRERVSQKDVNTTCVRYRKRYSNGVPGSAVYVGTNSWPQQRHYWRTWGFNTPHFHARQRKGELLPMTPFYQKKVDGECHGVYNMYYWITQPTVYDWYYATSGEWLPYSDWIVSEADLNAYLPAEDKKFVQAAAAEIYTKNGFDALTFIAELASVKRMFLSTGEKLLKLRFPKTKRELANSWLEGRYGWRPLVSDIRNLAQAIQSFNDRKQRHSEKKGYKTSWTNASQWITGLGTNNELHFSKSDFVTVGVNGCVTADIAVPKFQVNLFRTGWELIPYSFVIDWFCNVGQAISAASFLTLQNAYSACSGYMLEVVRDFRLVYYPASTSWGTFTQTANYTVKIESRSPCSVPLTPHTGLNLNPYKVIDLLGMIVQKRKGG